MSPVHNKFNYHRALRPGVGCRFWCVEHPAPSHRVWTVRDELTDWDRFAQVPVAIRVTSRRCMAWHGMVWTHSLTQLSG